MFDFARNQLDIFNNDIKSRISTVEGINIARLVLTFIREAGRLRKGRMGLAVWVSDGVNDNSEHGTRATKGSQQRYNISTK